MTFKSNLKELINLYKKAHLQSGVSARDLTRIRISKIKPESTPPKDTPTIVHSIEKRLDSIVKITRAELAVDRAMPAHKDSRHPLHRIKKRIILEEGGVSSRELSYLYDIGEETVKRYRREAGRNPNDGTFEDAAVTAAPDEVMKSGRNINQDQN